MSNRPDELESIPEMELSGGVRGKYYERYMQGTNVVLLEPDVARRFRDPAVINQALRTYLAEHSERADAGQNLQHKEGGGVEDHQQTWRLELTEPFLESLKRLPDSDAVGSVVAALLERISRQPQAAPVVAGTRVQMVTTAQESVHGERVPPLRLLYVLGHSNSHIKVLSIQPAETSLDLPANIVAQLQPLLIRMSSSR